MNMLITGGAGFIASHLASELINENNKVVCVDNLELGKKENIKNLMENENFSFYEMDVTDEERLMEII